MRVQDDPGLKNQLVGVAAHLCKVIEQMDLETGREYVNWLVRSADYMRTAPGFSPMNLVRYQLGDVIYVDFGSSHLVHRNQVQTVVQGRSAAERSSWETSGLGTNGGESGPDQSHQQTENHPA